MKKPTLLILAAGIGKRYGALKQIDAVGPNGEPIIDYSIYDALQAGCQKIVFVIRQEFARSFKKIIGAKYENFAEIRYVFQDLQRYLDGYAFPVKREKPWGTGHAVLSASQAINEPFIVINADDFYGPGVYRIMTDYLADKKSSGYAMVGYVLGNTLSDFGHVSRGICRHDEQMFLQEVTEHVGIVREPKGASYKNSSGQVHRLSGREIVSMNFWGFQPQIFRYFREKFHEFMKEKGNDADSEFYLPSVIDYLVKTDIIQVKILPTSNTWFGITYQQDRHRVVEKIRNLVADGIYPQRLF